MLTVRCFPTAVVYDFLNCEVPVLLAEPLVTFFPYDGGLLKRKLFPCSFALNSDLLSTSQMALIARRRRRIIQYVRICRPTYFHV